MLYIKDKHLVILVISGAFIWLFGAWAKITHQAYANAAISVSRVIMAGGFLLLLVKVLINKNGRYRK